MRIKNYTSSIPAEQSIRGIEAILLVLGARQISKEYGANKDLAAIYFEIPSPDEKDRMIAIRLPARVQQIENLFRAERSRHTPDSEERVKQQAQRTAWKLLLEWLQIEASLIKLRQKEFLEVFLSYAYNAGSKQTYFEALREKKFLALTR